MSQKSWKLIIVPHRKLVVISEVPTFLCCLHELYTTGFREEGGGWKGKQRRVKGREREEGRREGWRVLEGHIPYGTFIVRSELLTLLCRLHELYTAGFREVKHDGTT